MNNRYVHSRDDLAVCISLVAAVSILLSAVGAMWVWSSISDNRIAITIERDADIP